MRYILKPKKPVLNWLQEHGGSPRILPAFLSNKNGLVVAQLVAGKVVAEVIPTPDRFSAVCGSGIPLGRLYFQVPRKLLYSVCPDLKPNSFKGGTM